MKHKSSASPNTGNIGTLTILEAFSSHLFEAHNQPHLRSIMSAP